MSGFDAPFSRAHGPDIEAAGVREDDWLAFLDALNIAMVRICIITSQGCDLTGHIVLRRPARL